MPAIDEPAGAGRLAVVALLLLGAGSCGRDPQVHTVAIKAMQFVPAELTVAAGDTIEWKNQDFFPHTATAPGSFDSASIAAQGTWRYKATARGTYRYVCTLHPTMKGALTVR